MTSVLAVDFGGTKTATALVSPTGEMSEGRQFPATHDLAASAAQIGTAAEGADAVGIIVPGIYDESSGAAWCPNLWGSEYVPLLDAVRERIRVPVVIDSDRTGYVLGEQWLGAARGCRDVVFVAIGTGIGVGILSGGRVLRGAHGIAGAAGWFALTPEWKENYERTGCWEAEAAGPAVAQMTGVVAAEPAVEAALAGDPQAIAALRHAARFTGMGVANLISALNPEVVVLGGGLVQGAGSLMLDRVRQEAERWAQPVAMQRARIELTTLGASAGLLGAARLAFLDQFGEPNVSDAILRTHS